MWRNVQMENVFDPSNVQSKVQQINRKTRLSFLDFLVGIYSVNKQTK